MSKEEEKNIVIDKQRNTGRKEESESGERQIIEEKKGKDELERDDRKVYIKNKQNFSLHSHTHTHTHTYTHKMKINQSK